MPDVRSGYTADQCHGTTNTQGECALEITDSAGNVLADGGSYVPGATYTAEMVSECMGMQVGDAATCSGYGREVILEVTAGTIDPGAGSRGCGDTRMINPFRNPTITDE